jgi:hypothetical protein
MKGLKVTIGIGLCFISATALSAELITNNVTNQSILPPHAKLIAGNPAADEFYILGGNSSVVTPAAPAVSQATIKQAFAHNDKAARKVPVFASNDSMTHKPIIPHAHEYASLKRATHKAAQKAKADVVKIEMAFNHAGSKKTFAKKEVKGRLFVSNSKHKKLVG